MVIFVIMICVKVICVNMVEIVLNCIMILIVSVILIGLEKCVIRLIIVLWIFVNIGVFVWIYWMGIVVIVYCSG